MDRKAPVSLQSTAHYFLEGLKEVGVDYVFCNFGTDHAPLIEEMARWRRQGIELPKIILCPHENTAMHMAAGVASMTGRAQAVMVHVDAGTANCAMGAHNLRRSRVPVILMAGKAPYTVHGERMGSRDNYVHFIQEPYDQASIVRPYVKWEWTLPSGVIAKETLRRAHTMAMSDPQGPVYLMLPRETLAEEWDTEAVRSYAEDRFGPVRAGSADPEAIGMLAERLLAARHPVLLTSYAGRNPATPALIEELARCAGIRVFEPHALHLNVSRESECFLGIAPGEHLAEPDVGLMVDVDVPWIPRLTRENPAIWWAHIDVDVLKQDFPMWGFATDLRMQGDSRIILRQLLEAVKAKATPRFTATAAERLRTIAAESRARREKLAQAAADQGTRGNLNAAHVCAEIARRLRPEDIVVNEAVRNSPTVMNHVPRTLPGTFIGFGGGGLGCSAGLALGAKLARPEATVVQFIGDGGFYFNNPSSTYAVAKQYGLPILSVVFDNSGWSAVKEATLRMYADGNASATQEFAARLAPEVSFAQVVESAGGHGETVIEPEALSGAVERCMEAVRAGRASVLHVRIPSI